MRAKNEPVTPAREFTPGIVYLIPPGGNPASGWSRAVLLVGKTGFTQRFATLLLDVGEKGRWKLNGDVGSQGGLVDFNNHEVMAAAVDNFLASHRP